MRVSPCSIEAYVMDYDTVVSKFSFRLIALGKGMNPLIPPAMSYYYHYCFFMRIALNNPQRLICHLTKKSDTNANYDRFWNLKFFFNF